jgi:RNA polymerase sigma factor (TIGR02999 family)
MAEPGDITRLLQEADQGDRAAAEQLFPLVRDRLREIARRHRHHYRTPGLEASTTCLVDDAFCQLVGRNATAWHPGDRRKFFGYVSRTVHDLLVDAVRRQAAQRHGGQAQHVDADSGQIVDAHSPGPEALDFLLDLRDALTELEQFAPDDAAMFRNRYFLGCTFDELAGLMGVSDSEAHRRVERVKAWLRSQSKLRAYSLDA